MPEKGDFKRHAKRNFKAGRKKQEVQFSLESRQVSEKGAIPGKKALKFNI